MRHQRLVCTFPTIILSLEDSGVDGHLSANPYLFPGVSLCQIGATVYEETKKGSEGPGLQLVLCKHPT